MCEKTFKKQYTLAITTIIFNTTKEIEATSLSLSQLFNHISSEKA